MRTNKVKRDLMAGEVVVGTMIQEIRSPAIAQIFAAAGFDFFIIDMEHGAYDLVIAADIIKVARLEGICPLVRVPDRRYPPLGRILDIGALGLMVPRVETEEEVKEIVAEVKYPPLGRRGCSITMGNNDYRPQAVDAFIKEANQETLVIIQIELEKAVHDIDSLLSVRGVDVALIGPGDLSISLGLPGQPDHPQVLQAIDRVLAACEKYHVVPGIHLNNVDRLVEWLRRGMRMVAWSTDVWMLLNSGTEAVRRLRSEAAGSK